MPDPTLIAGPEKELVRYDEDLKPFQMAQLVFDCTVEFCDRFI